jgi:hypothetical protein
MIRKDQSGKTRLFWVCQCECGKITHVSAGHLNNGTSKSCGCLARENLSHRQTTHGLSRTSLYRTWSSMNQRCCNPYHRLYENYGARGITVCARWRNSFPNFMSDMGPKPSPRLSLERKNNNKGYNKSNCIWGTIEEQNRNKRGVIWVEYKGERMILIDFVRKINIRHRTAITRHIKKGRSTEWIFDRFKSSMV